MCHERIRAMKKSRAIEYQDRDEIVARMRWVEGKPWKEIRHALDIPKGSMQRIKKRIEKEMILALKIVRIVRAHNKK